MKRNGTSESKNLEIVILKDVAEILQLCRKSALVIEGLAMDSIPKYMEYLKKNTIVYRERVFVIKGSLMNYAYGLVGENKYRKNLHIVCIIPDDVLLEENTIKKIFPLGAKDLQVLEMDYSMMEVRRRAKEMLSTNSIYNTNDILFNYVKKDKSLEELIDIKPGLAMSPLGLSLLQIQEVRTKDEDIEKIYVNDKEILDRLYKEWALTMDGMPLWMLPFYMDFLESRTTVYRKKVYIIKGSTMNKEYGLTGSNAYPDDMCLVSVSREDVDQDDIRIAIDRGVVWARYFNDIVDNNLRRKRGSTREEEFLFKLLISNSRGIFKPLM